MNENTLAEILQEHEPLVCLALTVRTVLRALPHLVKNADDDPFIDFGNHEKAIGLRYLDCTFESLNHCIIYCFRADQMSRDDKMQLIITRSIMNMTAPVPDPATSHDLCSGVENIVVKPELWIVMSMAHHAINSANEYCLASGTGNDGKDWDIKVLKWMWAFHGLSDEFYKDIGLLREYLLLQQQAKYSISSEMSKAISLLQKPLYHEDASNAVQRFLRSLQSVSHYPGCYADWYSDQADQTANKNVYNEMLVGWRLNTDFQQQYFELGESIED